MNTREKIYNTAKRLYLENGFESTPNTMVAKQAGVNLGLVTYYYKTKDMIASDMLNHNYETLYKYLYAYLPVYDDMLMLVAFHRLHIKLTELDPDYDRFIYEMNKLDLVEKATRNGNLIDIFARIVNANDHIPQNKDTFLDIALSIYFGGYRALTIKQYEKMLQLTKDELFHLCMRTMMTCLDLDFESPAYYSVTRTADAIVHKLLSDHPDLKRTANYLYI
ncbi:MAG: TetR/AcrR family transcriptional regulator [Anaerofustis sp.]